MGLFIRVDGKNQWRGKDHISFRAGENDNPEMAEAGISCYDLRDPIFGIEQLYHYWFRFCLADLSSFKDSQITIFEGEHTGEYGTDNEDLAECNYTVAELNAYDFFKVIQDAKEKYKWEEITEDEYNQIIDKLIENIIVNI